MYAIVQVGSLQYRVSEGDTIDVERLEEKEGKALSLENVLLCADGDKVKIGQPYIKDVKVTAKVIREVLAPKAVSYKYRRRKSSDWKKGHRQKLTRVTITKISYHK